MDMKLDLFELLREFPEATLTVHAGDLGYFARELLAEARQDFERERAAIAEERRRSTSPLRWSRPCSGFRRARSTEWRKQRSSSLCLSADRNATGVPTSTRS